MNTNSKFSNTSIPIVWFRMPLGARYVLNGWTSLALWVVLLIFLIGLSSVKESLLPNYFFVDANTIADALNSSDVDVVGKSFLNTAIFFSLIGVSRESYLWPIISVIIMFSSVLYAASTVGCRKISIGTFGVIAFFMMLASIYLTVLSKDFIVFLLMTLFLFLAQRGAKGLAVWSFFGLLYAYLFREYWALVVFGFWGYRLVFRKNWSVIRVFFALALMLLVVATAFWVVLDVNLTSFRLLVNADRDGEEASRTLISSLIGATGFWDSWLDSILIFLTLVFPAPLLLLGGAYYLIIFAVLIFTQVKLWSAVRTSLRSRASPLMVSCSLMFFAFLSVQAVFEPDYGSYVRHLSALLPVITVLLLSNATTSYPDGVKSVRHSVIGPTASLDNAGRTS